MGRVYRNSIRLQCLEYCCRGALLCGRRDTVVQWLMHWTAYQAVWVSANGSLHFFLGKTLTLTLPLASWVYKWILDANPVADKHPVLAE